MSLRPVKKEDIPKLAEIHAESFAKAWTEASFVDLLARPDVKGLILDGPTGPVAFLLASQIDQSADILTLATAKSARRQGYASTLMAHFITHGAQSGLTRITLEVSATNLAARAFYATFGFHQDGIRPAYYRQPDGTRTDALLLSRRLDLR